MRIPYRFLPALSRNAPALLGRVYRRFCSVFADILCVLDKAQIVCYAVSRIYLYCAPRRTRHEIPQCMLAASRADLRALASGCSAANEELDADPVVARYRDTEIRQSLVDYEKKNQSALSGGKEVHDRDAVDQLLLNRIMLDEAERLGLSVTQEEVDAEFAAQKKNYEEFPEVRTYIDEYCKSAGITLDGYYAAIQDQLPRVILRQKLRNELGREYCAEQ